MSDWYSDLPAEELTGKHVYVEFDGGGTLEGRLVFDEKSGYVRLDNRPLVFDEESGYVRLDNQPLVVPVDNGSEVEMPFPALLFETADGIWCPLRGIRRIELAWDEREWELCPDDEEDPVDIAERVVVNGIVWQVVGLDEDNWGIRVCDVCDDLRTFCVDLSMITAYLRARTSAPDQPGVEGHHG